MFRTVLVKKTAKLQYIQGFLVVYDGEKEQKVYLKDVSLLIIEATGSLISVPLIVELVKQNTAVIFCDHKHNPFGTLLGISNHYNNSGNIYDQIKWSSSKCDSLWGYIVKTKIGNQIKALELFNLDDKMILLKGYINEIFDGDPTNREGLAAKVYFNEIFGKDFRRSDQSIINSLLDYGYSIILSCFNREIVSYGYLTQYGIYHRGKTNPFNLSSDFMEPFRPVVDIFVKLSIQDDDPIKRIRKILSKKIIINGEGRFLDDAIGVFSNCLFRYLNEESMELPIFDYYELEHYQND